MRGCRPAGALQMARAVALAVAVLATPSRAADCKDAVTRLIAEHLGVDRAKVVSGANLEKDLGADDLDQVELVLAMEEQFNIEISDEDADRMKTVGDMLAYANKNAKTGCR